ncbi:MAG: hypothetical protein O2816_12245 [Planctomycetota bacterium]|nr:hypothetical protein [Planctomycetota bacterium]
MQLPITDSDARSILRRLRDLNLATRLTIARGRNVELYGCASLDTPVERGVSYRVREDEDQAILRLEAHGADLDIRLEHAGQPDRQLHLELGRDEAGRALARSILARIDISGGNARDFEHFLRRLVRGLYAA